MTPNDLAQLLKHLRNDARLTCQRAASLGGVAPFTLHRWEAGANLEQIAKFMNYVERAYGVLWIAKRRTATNRAPGS